MPNIVDKAITDLEAAQIIQDEDLFVVEQDNEAKSVSGALIKQYASATVPTKTSELINDSHFVSDAAYVHTDNNYTGNDLLKLANIEPNAEENTIVTVKVNGTALTPDADRAVNVSVPDPVAATSAMTQPVGKDANGRLFTAPGGGSGGVVKVGSISLSTSWTGNDPYTQTVTVTGVTTTNNSLISIQPSNALLDQMETDGCKSLRIDNVNGVITAVARGAALTSALTVQVTVTEVMT